MSDIFQKDAEILTKEGSSMAFPILYELLRRSLFIMSDSLYYAQFKEKSFESCLKFLNYARITINIIPEHKISKELKEELEQSYSDIFSKTIKLFNAPKHLQVINVEDLVMYHYLFALIIKAIDKSGLGFSRFYAIATKKDLIDDYLERGR